MYVIHTDTFSSCLNHGVHIVIIYYILYILYIYIYILFGMYIIPVIFSLGIKADFSTTKEMLVIGRVCQLFLVIFGSQGLA